MILLFPFLTAVAVIATAADSYETHVAYAKERLNSDIPFENAIILLGPEFLDEFHLRENDEEHVVAPRVRIAHAEKTHSLGELLVNAGISLNTTYEATVFRKETKLPFVRVVGEIRELVQSQLPLTAEDLVVMREADKSR